MGGRIHLGLNLSIDGLQSTVGWKSGERKSKSDTEGAGDEGGWQFEMVSFNLGEV